MRLPDPSQHLESVPRLTGMSDEHGSKATAFRWATVAVLMLGMGIAVTISWFAFGRGDPYGLEPHHTLTLRRLTIYGSQFLAVGAFVFILVRTRLGAWSPVTLWAAVTSAWLLEGIVLTVMGTVVANELSPIVAWYFWLVATGGPLQPVAAFVGGWLGLRVAPVQS